MAEFPVEKVTEIDAKNSVSQDNSLVDADIKVSLFSCSNEDVNQLPQSPKEAGCLNIDLVGVVGKSTDVPLVDIEALKVLENKAVEVDRNLHRMMDNITRNISGISKTSVQYAECYRDCIKNVGNATDTATKAMEKLISKCEEMNKSMEPLYNMAEQVKTIEKLLDQFEEKCK